MKNAHALLLALSPVVGGCVAYSFIAYMMVVPDAFPTFPTLPTWLLISLCPPIVVAMALPTSAPFVLGLLFITGANAVLYMTIGIAIVRLVNAWQRG